jgi:hypothetical protein
MPRIELRDGLRGMIDYLKQHVVNAAPVESGGIRT